MKKGSSISLGPGAPSLILIFVALSLSVLGMLSLAAGRNDLRLSRRSVQVIEADYSLFERAEERRADICERLARGEDPQACLPEGGTSEDGVFSWQETDGVRTLDCALARDGETGRLSWIRHSLTAGTGEEWEDD